MATGCSHSSTSPTRDALTYAQAQQQSRDYAHQSLTPFPSGASLHVVSEIPSICSDSDGAPPSTPVNFDSLYSVLGLANQDLPDLLQKGVDYWKTQGWHTVTDRRPHSNFVSLQANGYAVTLSLAPNASALYIAVTSPCVPPETPTASTPPSN